jgi:hypothetical protein
LLTGTPMEDAKRNKMITMMTADVIASGTYFSTDKAKRSARPFSIFFLPYFLLNDANRRQGKPLSPNYCLAIAHGKFGEKPTSHIVFIFLKRTV